MYWYEKENGALLQCEKEGFIQFMREYNNREMKMSFLFDQQRRFLRESPASGEDVTGRTMAIFQVSCSLYA